MVTFCTRNEFEECAVFIPKTVFTKAFICLCETFQSERGTSVFLFPVVKLFIFQFLLNSVCSLERFKF